MAYNISTFQAPQSNLTFSGGGSTASGGGGGGGGSGGSGADAVVPVVGAIVSAFLSIQAGKNAKKIAGYNAAVYQAQAAFMDTQKRIESERIDIQKNLESARFKRFRGALNATFTARLASSGLDFSGSPVAVMVDNLTQIGIDESVMRYNFEIGKATNEYNLDKEKFGMLSTARAYKRQGEVSQLEGYSNAFSSMLKGTESAYKYFGKKG